MRIIVADDEFFARKALVKSIEELNGKIDFCKEAEDGVQVMELLEKYGADLVVTDIRMPDMDGLEVAQLVKEKYPETSVIIESGYADFEYATKAIRYGVKDYLTKPVKKEELEKAIQNVREEQKKIKQNIEKQVAFKRRQFMSFSHVLENAEAAKEILQDLFVKTQETSWYLLTMQSERKKLLKEEILRIIDILSKDENSVRVSYFYPKNEFILVIANEKSDIELETFIKKRLIECWNKVEMKMCVGISLQHEKTTNFVKEAERAYREAVYAINQRLLNPEKQVYQYQEEVEVVQVISQPEERQLEKNLMENKTTKATQQIADFLQKCEGSGEVSIYSLFASIIQIMNIINKVYSMKKEDASLEENKDSYLLFNFKTDLYNFYSMDQLKEYMEALIVRVSGEIEQKSSIISDLLKYLEWNYQYDITVNELAAHKYFVNPSYLSRLFKTETGMTFSKYLKELRMKKAAKLLQESDLKISDVASCVGYNDVSYFIQTFKKKYSMTPEQYKNFDK